MPAITYTFDGEVASVTITYTFDGEVASVTNATWVTWNCSVTDSTTTTCGTWGNWTTIPQTITLTDNATGTVWRLWSNASTAATNTGTVNLPATPARAETEEERAARIERNRRLEEEARQRAEQERRKADEAKARAEELLKEHLSDEQRREYEADRSFHVVTASGRRYRVRHGWAGNVDELDEAGQAIKRYCIHPRVGCPVPDNMLAQKLMLQTDEEAFRRVANKSRPPAQQPERRREAAG